MYDRLWNFFVETMMVLFLPAVSSYHLLCDNIFLNVAAQNASGLERAGDTLLSPFQYLFAGRAAFAQQDGSWILHQRFDYHEAFWIKTSGSMVLVIPSFVIGSLIKTLGYLSQDARARYRSLCCHQKSTACSPNFDLYKQLGIAINDPAKTEKIDSQGYKRRPEDEHTLQEAKEALADIVKVLNEAKIIWWADCGTCLGVYRYGGVIPWDDDIDLAILEIDFENARRAFNQLDPKKYHVQDWSSRSFPNSFFKIYMRGGGAMIDIYCFKINFDKREVATIFSLEETIFFPEWFKVRERRFSVPTSLDMLFPLKKGNFDDIEVFIPNQTKQYLQRVYGENLDPVKIYDPKTGRFEKDLSHPYWLQMEHAH